MRNIFDANGGFVLCCPVSDGAGTPVREIRKRGNIPLVLQEDVVVERAARQDGPQRCDHLARRDHRHAVDHSEPAQQFERGKGHDHGQQDRNVFGLVAHGSSK